MSGVFKVQYSPFACFCFKHNKGKHVVLSLQAKLQERPIAENRAADGSSTPCTGLTDGEDSQTHAVQKLKDMLIQRDNEISILYPAFTIMVLYIL